MLRLCRLSLFSPFSAEMLKDRGVPWVILGHSERRTLNGESNEVRAGSNLGGRGGGAPTAEGEGAAGWDAVEGGGQAECARVVGRMSVNGRAMPCTVCASSRTCAPLPPLLPPSRVRPVRAAMPAAFAAHLTYTFL